MKIPLPRYAVENKLSKVTQFTIANNQKVMDRYIAELEVFPTMSGHTFEWEIGRIKGYITGKDIKEAAKFLSKDLRIVVPTECLRLISETERRILEQGKSI